MRTLFEAASTSAIINRFVGSRSNFFGKNYGTYKPTKETDALVAQHTALSKKLGKKYTHSEGPLTYAKSAIAVLYSEIASTGGLLLYIITDGRTTEPQQSWTDDVDVFYHYGIMAELDANGNLVRFINDEVSNNSKDVDIFFESGFEVTVDGKTTDWDDDAFNDYVKPYISHIAKELSDEYKKNSSIATKNVISSYIGGRQSELLGASLGSYKPTKKIHELVRAHSKLIKQQGKFSDGMTTYEPAQYGLGVLYAIGKKSNNVLLYILTDGKSSVMERGSDQYRYTEVYKSYAILAEVDGVTGELVRFHENPNMRGSGMKPFSTFEIDPEDNEMSHDSYDYFVKFIRPEIDKLAQKL